MNENAERPVKFQALIKIGDSLEETIEETCKIQLSCVDCVFYIRCNCPDIEEIEKTILEEDE